MLLRTTAIAGIIILGSLLLFHNSNNDTKSIQSENINAFIQKEKIQDPNIVRISDSKYYLFSNKSNSVYVYERNGNSHTSHSVPRNGIVFGGLEPGSFGLIIQNDNILKNASKYNLIIDGESKTYEYNHEIYLVVQDQRIWNPTPQVTIEFLDKQQNIILKESF
ncbi:hypothetical protein [Paenibacillus campi]|uniref:hypothetical protein n=1 Tax=Paenibacillus campi TaxID=3106031 RepID=UPI002AFFCEC4|nr:hypothetical protein [Paenibacillus sp. SGZ-1009]